MVTTFSGPGATGAAGSLPGSFRTSPNSAEPTSLKIVGDETGCPSTVRSTLVTTSDNRFAPNSLGFAPCAAASDRITSCEGERPCVARSPQPAKVTAMPIAASAFQDLNIALTVALLLNNPRRDEDEQLSALIRHFVAPEQQAEERDLAEPRRTGLGGLLCTQEDAADDRGVAVGDANTRQRALGVDRRVVFNRAREIGRAVFEFDLHDYGVCSRNLRQHAE